MPATEEIHMINSNLFNRDTLMQYLEIILEATISEKVAVGIFSEIVGRTMFYDDECWLSNVISSLGAWFEDDYEIATTSLKRSQLINDKKTSLFFSGYYLLCSSSTGHRKWLKHYLKYIDPQNVDKITYELLQYCWLKAQTEQDKSQLKTIIVQWYDPSLVNIDYQEKIWRKYIQDQLLTDYDYKRDYPLMNKYVEDFSSLEEIFLLAESHENIKSVLQKSFEEQTEYIYNIQDIKQFIKCIIDVDSPASNYRSVDTKIQMSNFIRMLSKDQIINTYALLVDQARSYFPEKLIIKIAQWQETTALEPDDYELKLSLQNYSEPYLEHALSSVTLSIVHWFELFSGVLIIVLSIPLENILYCVIGFVLFIVGIFGCYNILTVRKAIRAKNNELLSSYFNTLSELTNEIRTYYKVYINNDEKYESQSDLFQTKGSD